MIARATFVQKVLAKDFFQVVAAPCSISIGVVAHHVLSSA